MAEDTGGRNPRVTDLQKSEAVGKGRRKGTIGSMLLFHLFQYRRGQKTVFIEDQYIQELLKRLDCRIHTSCRMAEMAERIRSDERDLSQRRQDQVVSFMIGQNSCNGHDPFHGKCTAGKRGIHPKWRKEFIIKDEIQRPPGDGFDDTADDAVTQVGIPEGISRKAAARPADHFRDRPA